MVEPRAFCSKHSSVGYVNSLEKSNSASEKTPREVSRKYVILGIGKIPKLRFTRKNKERFMYSMITLSFYQSGDDGAWYFAMVLKKLIDRGDVSVSDIASEVGISSASLEAALVLLSTRRQLAGYDEQMSGHICAL